MKRPSVFAALLILMSCSYPTTQVSTVDTRPHLSIEGAPENAVLTVDNVSMGAAANYAPDKHQITLDHGTHHIVVSLDGKVLYDNSVYLGEGVSSTVTVPQ